MRCHCFVNSSNVDTVSQESREVGWQYRLTLQSLIIKDSNSLPYVDVPVVRSQLLSTDNFHFVTARECSNIAPGVASFIQPLRLARQQSIEDLSIPLGLVSCTISSRDRRISSQAEGQLVD